MQIIALAPIRNPIRAVKEHDRILLLLAQRAQEWQSQRGIRRLIARIKIEVWAWREAAREQSTFHALYSRTKSTRNWHQR